MAGWDIHEVIVPKAVKWLLVLVVQFEQLSDSLKYAYQIALPWRGTGDTTTTKSGSLSQTSIAILLTYHDQADEAYRAKVSIVIPAVYREWLEE